MGYITRTAMYKKRKFYASSEKVHWELLKRKLIKPRKFVKKYLSITYILYHWVG